MARCEVTDTALSSEAAATDNCTPSTPATSPLQLPSRISTASDFSSMSSTAASPAAAASTAQPSASACPSWALILMGVSGCGKSCVGAAAVDAWNASQATAGDSSLLPARLLDGDAYHPQANIDKMASGHPLNDDDRAGWLATLAQLMRGELAKGEPAIIACSALKVMYRRILFAPAAAQADASASAAPDAASAPAAASVPASCPRLFLVHLDGSAALLSARMHARKGHFMKPHMLASQLETLEPPTEEECATMGVKFLRINLDEKQTAEQEGQQIVDFIRKQQQQSMQQ